VGRVVRRRITALTTLLTALPAGFRVPVLVVQHLDPGTGP